MIDMNCIEPYTVATGIVPAKAHFTFQLTKVIPKDIAPQIEAAVKDFIKSSHMPQGVDLNGFYYQTLGVIANASVLGGQGDLWLGILDGQLVSYVLGHFGSDYDGRLAYTVSQGWVRKDQRGMKWVKDAWKTIRERAKNGFAKHFVVLSSRGGTELKTKAYCRFLGKGFHPYAEILKTEL